MEVREVDQDGGLGTPPAGLLVEARERPAQGRQLLDDLRDAHDRERLRSDDALQPRRGEPLSPHAERREAGTGALERREQPGAMQVAGGLARRDEEVHGIHSRQSRADSQQRRPRAPPDRRPWPVDSPYFGNGYISHATARPPRTSEPSSVPKSFQRSRRLSRHSSAKNAGNEHRVDRHDQKVVDGQDRGHHGFFPDAMSQAVQDEEEVHQAPRQQVRAAVLVGRREDRAPGVLREETRGDVQQARAVDREGRQNGQRLARLDRVEAALKGQAGEKRQGRR